MLETRWYFVRHAPVDNPEGRIYGASNPSANVSDFGSFEILAQRLPINAVSVTSHLLRTHQTIERVQTCVRELTLKFKGKDIVCVAHGGSIRAALALALGLNGDQAISFSIDNLSTTVIDYIHPENGFYGGWRVRGTNLPSV